jgi:urocanate hydratase
LFHSFWPFLFQTCNQLDACVARIKKAREEKKPLALGFHGNIVDLWERLAEEKEMLVELGSDQTSLHNPYSGGYFPAGKTLAVIHASLFCFLSCFS